MRRINNFDQCPTCLRQMVRGATQCHVCKAAPARARTRARYVEDIASAEIGVRLYTVDDADYEQFFVGIPRYLIDDRRRRAEERLDWLQKRLRALELKDTRDARA